MKKNDVAHSTLVTTFIRRMGHFSGIKRLYFLEQSNRSYFLSVVLKEFFLEPPRVGTETSQHCSMLQQQHNSSNVTRLGGIFWELQHFQVIRNRVELREGSESQQQWPSKTLKRFLNRMWCGEKKKFEIQIVHVTVCLTLFFHLPNRIIFSSVGKYRRAEWRLCEEKNER